MLDPYEYMKSESLLYNACYFLLRSCRHPVAAQSILSHWGTQVGFANAIPLPQLGSWSRVFSLDAELNISNLVQSFYGYM